MNSSLVPRLGLHRVRSYLREDLLFGKSFSRCQPAAGRTELTAHTPQFLFPLPLPSSTSGLRLSLVYLPSLTLLLANTLHSSSIRRACILLSATRSRDFSEGDHNHYTVTLSYNCNSIVNLDNANWTTARVTIIEDVTVHHIDTQIVDYL